ncbi:hypothetical protein FOZ60_016176 [Perkinsus olseni]|uniref:RRM domain-containing protein n=1 Tax=Perkinsus olseni TaxID=32597 RepID=A0A7J6N4C6_PEROL|nr:hypothetical protein FOZ60_016176 [Perkinsus olseni]
MWLLWDEYEVLCRNTGITEGLITNNKILRGDGVRDIISTTGIQSNHDPTRQQQQQKKKKNKDAAGAGAIYVPLDDPEKEAKRKKRREYRARKKLKQQAGLWKARVKEENNSSIYISGLPDDSTVEELYDLFKLAGAIKRDLETGHYKIKIYGLNDDDDNNNNNGSSWGIEEEEGEKKRVPTSSSSSSRRTGDALISYQSVESVPIAIDRYDDYKLREDCRIHVARASFDHYGDSTVKRDKVDNTPDDDDVANHLDNDTLKLMASRNNKRRLKLLELRRKEVEAAASWEDDQAGRDRAWKPIIVLKGMYTVQEANSDHAEGIYAAIKQDVQSEMCKFGEVKKVVVIEDSLDAYVCIKFKTMDEAQNAAAHLASNNLTIPSTSSTAAVDRKASDMFFHDGRDLKSRPIIPPPTPSNNSVAGSSSSSNDTTSIYDDINTVTRVTDDKATEREKDWERFLEGDDDSSDDDDDEFIIHEEGEEDTLHPPE